MRRPGKEQLRSAYFAYPLVDTKALLKCIVVPVDASMLQALSDPKSTVICRSNAVSD